jgi:hypothetical protein
MFPEMFPALNLPSPEEQARKEAGLPYDATKKMEPLEPGKQQRDEDLATGLPPAFDRNRFEKTVFEQIGGNPFMVNPYDAVVKSDSELPGLFNHVFQGRATWSDLPKLSKEQRAFWEDVKKQHHRRAYDRAKAKKDGMMQQYNWMMSKFDYAAKQQHADEALEEKRRATQEAMMNKTPSSRELYNDQGIRTLHEYDPKRRTWVDTGKRTGVYALEDQVPPYIKQMQSYLNRYAPKPIDPTMMFVIAQIGAKDPARAEKLIKQMTGGVSVPPEEKEKHARISAVVNKWFLQNTDRAMKQLEDDLAKAEAAAGGSSGPGEGFETMPGKLDHGGAENFNTMPGKLDNGGAENFVETMPFRPGSKQKQETPKITHKYDPVTKKVVPVK